MKDKHWPELFYEDAKETYQTIHLWSQILGKIKLSEMPWINHSWHTTLLVSTTGLSTGDLPADNKHFSIDLNFLTHKLEIFTSLGEYKSFGLQQLSVATFYQNILEAIHEFGIDVKINPIPNEMLDPIPLDKDHQHKTYDPGHVSSLHKVLLNVNEVFNVFRAEFIGKSSPSHFFWGSFDLAVSRFSGRKAPKHPGGIPNLPDWVAQEAYSHEVSSSGFWPGNEMLPSAAFYNYIYPEPKGFNECNLKPEGTYYKAEMGEFILPYEVVQKAKDPAKVLLEFLQETYKAAAELAKWDREALESATT